LGWVFEANKRAITSKLEIPWTPVFYVLSYYRAKQTDEVELSSQRPLSKDCIRHKLDASITSWLHFPATISIPIHPNFISIETVLTGKQKREKHQS
jgi:hypothetical protein